MTEQIDEQTIAAVARLAALDLGDAELDIQRAHLQRLLGFVSKLSEADVSDIEPMAHPLDAEQPLRPDEATEINRRDELMSNAPESEDGLFLVPRVME